MHCRFPMTTTTNPQSNTPQSTTTDADRLAAWNAEFAAAFPSAFIVCETERNGAHDSDFGEWLWDDATGTFVHVATGTTRGWCPAYSSNLPRLRDADPAVQDRARQVWAAAAGAARRASVEAAALAWIEDQDREAAKPRRGDTVETTRRIKATPRGTVGVVVWIGTDSFSGGDRYGIDTDTDAGRVYVNGASLRVVARADGAAAPRYVLDTAAIDADAAEAEAAALARPGAVASPPPIPSYRTGGNWFVRRAD
jgi:hypothetical protein